ncbi:MAG: hypothetical protein IRZ10_04790 [Thermoflavifilum sp.]|nr:hypothetical protein [Thermoflavifilum sp.]MCL6513715.1 hypothetical protein [Alicyclobacillus sp.]
MAQDPKRTPAAWDEAYDQATNETEAYEEMSIEDQVARMAGEGGVATEIPHRPGGYNPPEAISDGMPSE